MQSLMEQYKDRKDVVFLSLNIDDNPGLIGPIMAEQKLSFIVLPAYSYVNDKLKIDDYISHNINYLRDVLGIKLPPHST